eukprot:m.342876 g.342876  ORF g.342876 m.342876 type:complete len:293 (+) comp21943_c0_seq1:243-1121(+)
MVAPDDIRVGNCGPITCTQKRLTTWIDFGVGWGVLIVSLCVMLAGTTMRYDACLNATKKLIPSNESMNPNLCGDLWDHTLGYPLKASTVGTGALLGTVILVPIGSVILMFLYDKSIGVEYEERRMKMRMGFLSILQICGMTMLFTESAKHYVGRYRPDAYEALARGGHIAVDAHWSYPSGHSSLSFASLLFTFYFVADHTHAMGGLGSGWKLTLCMVFPFAAGFIATSRLVDYKHNPSDVNAGAFLGTLISTIFYHANFIPSWITLPERKYVSAGLATKRSGHVQLADDLED